MSRAPLRVIMLCGRGGPAYGVLRSLHAMGARTWLICPARTAIRLSRCCERVVFTTDLPPSDPLQIADVINRLHAERPIDLVLGGDIAGLVTIGRIKDELRPSTFPMPPVETLQRLNNKWEFYKLCTAFGLGTPRTEYVADASSVEPDRLIGTFGLPLVVKPLAASGGDGVSIIRDRAGLMARLHDGAEDSGVLVQEYIEGADWCLSVFARDGHIEAWSTFACGAGWATKFQEHRELLAMGARIIAETRYSGVANFDARLDRRGLTKLLECNPRFFKRVTSTRLCGLDFVKAAFEPGPVSLTAGCYYSLSDLFFPTGWERLIRGEWAVSAVLQDARELVVDPLPTVAKWLRTAAKAVAPPFMSAGQGPVRRSKA